VAVYLDGEYLAVLFFPSVDLVGCNFADKGLFVLHFDFFVVLPGRSRIVVRLRLLSP
jgi:hypothetical protein